MIAAGNGMHMAAESLGWTMIAAVRSDLAGIERAGYAIADNRTPELSSWDPAALGILLSALPPDMVTAAGFTANDLQGIFGDKFGHLPEDIDDVPAPPEKATTRKGDLWILGDHRLLCGDSSSAADLDRLLAGAKVQLVNTDPPYNVKVEPRSNNAIAAGLSSFGGAFSGHQQSADIKRYPEKGKATTKTLRAKDRPLANDFVSDEAFDKLLDDWFGNIARVLVPGGGFYIWGGYANCGNYPPVLKRRGLYFSQAVIWVKEHPVLTRKDFMGNHEWCFYGWREGAAHSFHGPSNVPDVWSVKKVNPNAMVHLTEKPVELARRAIEFSSKPGDVVLDLFGGSGSTLVAANLTGRRAMLMELDELYCDVIVQRWEKLTGKKALREESVQDVHAAGTAREGRAAATAAIPAAAEPVPRRSGRRAAPAV